LQFPHAAPSIKQSWPKDHWETFLANAGLNFFQHRGSFLARLYLEGGRRNRDHPRVQSTNESLSWSESHPDGTSESQALTQWSPRCGSQSATTKSKLDTQSGELAKLLDSHQKNMDEGLPVQ
jgi:hypothetical protein